MVGGSSDVFEVMRPLFEAMGTTIVLQGGPGAGQHTKMVNQVLIASTMVAMSEGLLYTARVGLDVEQVLASVTSGAAGSWSLSNLAPRVVAGNFAPGFLVDHLVKDLGIALAEAKRAKVALPGLALANQLYVALQAQGRGRDGTQTLVHALASLSGSGGLPLPARMTIGPLTSPSHDQCGMARPSGTSAADWWWRDIVVSVVQAK